MFILINSIIEEPHLERCLEKAFWSAKILEAEIDINEFENIDWSEPKKSEYFFALTDLMEFDGESDRTRTTNDTSGIIFDGKDYCWIYPVIGGDIKSGICDQIPVNLPFKKVVEENLISVYE